jgi:predicted aspartyl protease
MSTFRYPIEIGDTDQARYERMEAWVDTGASYTWIPQPILDRLGYFPTGRRRFRMANGSAIERDVCRVNLRIGQDVEFTLCVFGDEDSEPLLGATALEEFALGVDPVHHTLVPVVLNLLSFSPEAG